MKKFKYVLFFIVMLFILEINIFADDKDFVKGGKINYDFNGDATYGNVNILDKTLGGQRAYCISGFDIEPKDNGTCSSVSTDKVIGEIIASSCNLGENGCYILKELAIAKYNNKNLPLNESYWGDAVDNLISAATTSAAAQVDLNSIKYGFSSESIGIFSIENGYFLSNAITAYGISNLSELNVVSDIKGVVLEQTSQIFNGEFKIKIPVNNVVKDNSTITIEYKTKSISKTNNIATLYNCNTNGVTGKQDVAILTPQTKTITASSISGTISPLKTVVSKISAVDSKELPGAKLQILLKDEDDNPSEMACTILDEDGNIKELESCSWESGKKPVTIIGLLPGKYYLKETLAPKGYVLNTEMVEFEVKDDGTTTNVQMKNELEVEVPDTLSNKSALLLAIAMFDIALGIGIITYVKKNKVEE